MELVGTVRPYTIQHTALCRLYGERTLAERPPPTYGHMGITYTEKFAYFMITRIFSLFFLAKEVSVKSSRVANYVPTIDIGSISCANQGLRVMGLILVSLAISLS